jgi:hypothetical protein
MTLNDLKPDSGTSIVQEHLEAIEAAIARRVSIKAIHEELCKSHGLKLTDAAFRSTLKRVRAARKTEEGKTNTPVAEVRVESASRASVQIEEAKQERPAEPSTPGTPGRQSQLREVMGKDTNPDPGGFIDV